MVFSPKGLIQLGAAAGALAAIGGLWLGAWSFAKPYTESEPPPYADLAHLTATDLHVAQNAAEQQRQKSEDKATQQNVLFLSQQFWTLQLSQAEAQIRQNPGNISAIQQKNAAQQALAGIQKQLYGGAP